MSVCYFVNVSRIENSNLPKLIFIRALTRPGRFDMTVTVPKPDARGRQQILDLYLGKIKVGPGKFCDQRDSRFVL